MIVYNDVMIYDVLQYMFELAVFSRYQNSGFLSTNMQKPTATIGDDISVEPCKRRASLFTEYVLFV